MTKDMRIWNFFICYLINTHQVKLYQFLRTTMPRKLKRIPSTSKRANHVIDNLKS